MFDNTAKDYNIMIYILVVEITPLFALEIETLYWFISLEGQTMIYIILG